MAKLIEFEGQQYEFPDDATDQEISGVLAKQPATAPVAQQRPVPSLGESVAYGADVLQQLGYASAEWAGEAGLESIIPGTTEFGRTGREAEARELAGATPPLKLSEIGGIGDVGQYAKQALGQQAPLMAPPLIGAAAGGLVGGPIGAAIGAGLGSLPLGIGEVQTIAKEKAPGVVSPGWVALGGTAIAALDSLLGAKFVGRMVRQVGKEAAEGEAKRLLEEEAKKGVVRRTAEGVWEGVKTEVPTEAAQEVIGEVAGAQAAGQEPNYAALPEQMAEAAATALVPGATVGGIAGAATRQPAPFQNAATDDLRELDLSRVPLAAPPGLPKRPAYHRPGGPTDNQATLDKEAFDRARREMAGMEKTPSGREEFMGRPVEGGRTPDAKEVLYTDWQEYKAAIDNSISEELIAEQVKQGVGPGEFFGSQLPQGRQTKEQQKAKAAGLRAKADALKKRQASMTELEKYELAKQEQEIRLRQEEQQAIAAKKKREAFKVIPGGKEEEPGGTVQEVRGNYNPIPQDLKDKANEMRRAGASQTEIRQATGLRWTVSPRTPAGGWQRSQTPQDARANQPISKEDKEEAARLAKAGAAPGEIRQKTGLHWDANRKAWKRSVTAREGRVNQGYEPPQMMTQEPPDPSTVPYMPPEDNGLPIVTTPETAMATAATVPQSYEILAPEESEHVGVVAKGVPLEGLSVITFETPGGVEQTLAFTKGVSEQTSDLVYAKRSDFDDDSVTALLDDLPTLSNEGARVKGGDYAARDQLRAAIDAHKISKQALLMGDDARAIEMKGRAFQHYVAFVKAGGRVKPSKGAGFLLMGPGRFLKKLRKGTVGAAPRTTRTKATHFFLPMLEEKGMSLFSRSAPRLGHVPAAAIDVAKIPRDRMTAMPFFAAVQRHPMASGPFEYSPPTPSLILLELEKVGVFFTRPPDAKLLQDVDRFLWKLASDNNLTEMPKFFQRGIGKEFTNLIQRGMRIRVEPHTLDFIVRRVDAERAVIPGVSFPSLREEIKGALPPGGWGGLTERTRLTVTYGAPMMVPVIPKQRLVLRNATRAIRVAFKRLGIRVNLRVTPATSQYLAARFNPDYAAAEGMLYTDLQGNLEVLVNLDRHFTPEGAVDTVKMLGTLAHEVAGHALIEFIWHKLPYHIQDQLMVLAEREQLALRTAKKIEANARTHSAIMFNVFSGGPGSQYPLAADPQLAEYFSGLHEIFAREMERWAVSEFRFAGKGPASFLSQLRSAVTTLYDTFKTYDPNFFEPHEAIRNLVQFLKDNPVLDSHLGENTAQKHEQSLRPTGKLALPGVEHPRTGATNLMRDGVQTLFGTSGGGRGGPTDFWRGFNAAASAWDALAYLDKKVRSIVEIARSNRVRLPELSFFVDVLRRFNAFVIRQTVRHDETLASWNLGDAESDRLTSLLFYMTEMQYRTAEEKRAEVRRQPTRDEFLAALRRFGISSQRTLDVYLQIQRDFSDHLDLERQIWEAAAARTWRDQPQRFEEEMAKIAAEIAAKKMSPYFPMTRFGDYYVYVKDIAGKVVYAENWERAAERDANVERIRRAHPSQSGYEVISDMKIAEELKPFMGMSTRTMQMIKERLNLAQYPELAKQFDVLQYELGPERSFKKHRLGREGIPGYSTDTKRVYADYFMHGDRNLARLLFEADMQASVNDVYKAKQRFANPREKDSVSRLGDFSQKLMNDVLSPADDYARVRAGLAAWVLGFVPLSAMIQLSQLLVAGAHLTNQYGTVTGTRQMGRAIKTSIRHVRSLLTQGTVQEDPVKQRARRVAYEQAVLKDGLAADMANVASGNPFSKYAGRNKLSRGAAKAVDYSMWGIAAADNFGRHVVWDAAYDLAQNNTTVAQKIIDEFPDYERLYLRLISEDGMTAEQARTATAAAYAVNTTYFETGRWAKPEILRGKLAIAFMFYTFPRAILNFMFTVPGRGRYWAMFFALAGAMGMPFSEDINNIMKQLAGLFGVDWSPEKEAKRFLIDVFGKDSKMPGLIMHGLASESLGITLLTDPMGVPFPHFDISPSVSLGRLIPMASDFDIRSGFNPKEQIADVAIQSTGVAGDLFMNGMRFLYSPYGYTDAKTWEYIEPRFLKNLSKGVRIGVSGSERTSKGKMFGTEFDMSDPGDALEVGMLAVGSVQPHKLTTAYRTQNEVIESINFYKSQRSILSEGLRQAWASGDKHDIQEAIAEIREFNTSVREQKMGTMAIDVKRVQQAFGQQNRVRQRLEKGLPPEQMYAPLAREQQRIFGGEVISSKKVR